MIRPVILISLLFYFSFPLEAVNLEPVPVAGQSGSSVVPPPPWTPMGETFPTVLDCQNCFQLTTEGPSQSGCLWDDETVDLSGPLDITVKMMFGDDDAGADGICLVLAASPDCGMYGADIGAGGIANSVIFEFDTWDNGPGYGDLPNDHVSMNINGIMSTPLFGPSDVGNIEDGATHTVRFVWDGAGGFQIFLDGVLVLSGNYDFSSAIGGTEAFFGFTASTGGAWNNQIVCPEEDPVSPPDPASFIQADLSVCANEQDVPYAVDPVTGVTYQWTAPPGASVNGSGSSVTIDWGTEGGDVCVVLDNGCGMSAPVCVTVEVTPLPEVQVDPPGVICAQDMDLNGLVLNNLQPGEVFTFHPDEEAAENGSPDLGNPPIVNTSGTYWIRIVAGDGCVQLIPVMVELEWLDLFVVQPAPLCAPGSLDLSFVDVIDQNGNQLTGFSYYPTQQDAEDQSNPLPGSTVSVSGSYWVRAETANGCWGVAEILVEFLAPPLIQVIPPPVQCAIDSFDLGTIDVQELTGLPPNAYTITFHNSAVSAGSGMPVLDPPVVNQAGTYWVRATNLAGCFDTVSFPLTFLETPSVYLTGGGMLCEGEIAQLTFQFGGVPPFQVTYTNGMDTFSLSGSVNPLVAMHQVDTTTSFIILSFSDQTPPGCPPSSGGIATFQVTQKLQVSPAIKTCDMDQYIVTFSVSGGDSTTWFVSGGPGIFQGDTFQSAPIGSGMPFAFQIWDATGCDTLQVTGVENCDCLTDAGNFIETMVDVCWTDTLYLTFSGNGFLEGDDIRQYVLHQGTSIQLQSIKAWNDQPVFVFDPTTMMTGVTYYVSPVAGNNLSGTVDTTDLCLSVTPGIPVIFHGSPGLITPVGDTICASMIYDLPVLFNGTAPYTLSYQMNGGAIQQQGFVSGTGSLSITGMTSGMVQFLTLSDGYCTTGLTDSFQLVVHFSPSVINIDVDCDGSNASYVVTFQITGGDSTTYTVSGPGVLTGTVFQSDPLSAGSTYSFLVTDQHDCSPVLVSGNHDCLCQTDAGDLLGGPVFICAGDSLWVQGSGTFLDADDTLVYWLVSDFMDPVKTMLWQFDQSHLFYPGLPVMTGQVYYVVAVAGNSGNTGAIDTTDVCLDYSNSIPVTFVQPPVVHAILPSPSNQFTCQDTIITLAATTSPVSGLNYSWTTYGGTLHPPANLSSVKTTSPGWYTILLTEQTAGCQDSAGIWLGASLGLPQVVILPPALLNCVQLAVILDASGSATGPNSVFLWSTFDGQIISGNSTSVAQVDQPGTYQLSIIDLSSDCSSTGSILVYQDTIPPVADAGPDLVIPCGQSAGVLSGINSSGQGALSFAWSTQGGAFSGPSDQMTADAAQVGKYLLTVTDNQNGCTDADEVDVTQAGGLIVSGILVDPPHCFGEASGQITLESITGGQGPYQAMLGSISMPAPGSFSGITGGTYLLKVNDALGCTWDSTFVVEEPPVVLIDLGLDLTVDFGTTVVLTPNVLSPGSGIGSFVWSDPDSILCVGCPQLTVLPATDIFISLEVQDQVGCTAEDDILIRVILRRRVFIPNSFSPNFDGINDVFAVSGGETVDRVKSMAVYDRWGNSLFLRKDFPADGISGWNGQYRGQQMDPGVYVYVVEVVFIDGSERLYKGDLQIMR